MSTWWTRKSVVGAGIVVLGIALVAGLRFCRATESVEPASTVDVSREGVSSPARVKFECGSDLPCVAKKAAIVEELAASSARADVAERARDLRVALEAGDCRAAMAADGRLDAVKLEPGDSSALFVARVSLMTELLNSCLLGPPGTTTSYR